MATREDQKTILGGAEAIIEAERAAAAAAFQDEADTAVRPILQDLAATAAHNVVPPKEALPTPVGGIEVVLEFKPVASAPPRALGPLFPEASRSRVPQSAITAAGRKKKRGRRR